MDGTRLLSVNYTRFFRDNDYAANVQQLRPHAKGLFFHRKSRTSSAASVVAGPRCLQLRSRFLPGRDSFRYDMLRRNNGSCLCLSLNMLRLLFVASN